MQPSVGRVVSRIVEGDRTRALVFKGERDAIAGGETQPAVPVRAGARPRVLSHWHVGGGDNRVPKLGHTFLQRWFGRWGAGQQQRSIGEEPEWIEGVKGPAAPEPTFRNSSLARNLPRPSGRSRCEREAGRIAKEKARRSGSW